MKETSSDEKDGSRASPFATCGSLDFLHGENHENDDEKDLPINWSSNSSNSIDWNRPTWGRDVYEAAILSTVEERTLDETDEEACSPDTEVPFEQDRHGAYDFESVMTLPSPTKLAAIKLEPVRTSSTRTMDSSADVDTDADATGVTEDTSSFAVKDGELVSPRRKKRSRTLIVCLSFALLVLIPIVVLAFLGFFDKNSSAPAEPTDVGSGSDAGDDNVSTTFTNSRMTVLQ